MPMCSQIGHGVVRYFYNVHEIDIGKYRCARKRDMEFYGISTMCIQSTLVNAGELVLHCVNLYDTH
jgi:hypothetical protein